MAEFIFTPGFSPVPWIDNKTRVQAGGSDGFNARFATLENDLQAISTVIGQIDTAFKALQAGTGPVSHVLRIAPVLNPVINGAPWSLDSSGFAVRSTGNLSCNGLAPVTLPDQVTLTDFRASGQNTGAGVLNISLWRANCTGPAHAGDQISAVTTFDTQGQINPAFATVNTTSSRYFILATLAGSVLADLVSIAGFQITYTA